MRIIKLTILFCLISFWTTTACQGLDNKPTFAELDKEVAINDWGSYNKDKAMIFEKIYNENLSNAEFISKLLDYTNNEDRCYWIGIYLDEPYYTKINNFNLSTKVLEKGLSLTKDEEEKVRFYFVLGKKYYYQKIFKKAKGYLVAGYKLSEKYPGSIPTWDSDEEYEAIMKFIKTK